MSPLATTIVDYSAVRIEYEGSVKLIRLWVSFRCANGGGRESHTYVWATPPKQVETAYNSCIAREVESAQNLLAGEGLRKPFGSTRPKSGDVGLNVVQAPEHSPSHRNQTKFLRIGNNQQPSVARTLLGITLDDSLSCNADRVKKYVIRKNIKGVLSEDLELEAYIVIISCRLILGRKRNNYKQD